MSEVTHHESSLVRWLCQLLAIGVACMVICSEVLSAQEQVVDKYPNGKAQRIYSVDAEGRKHGRFESFYQSGDSWVVTTYHKDRIQGLWRETGENGKPIAIKTFRFDVLNGNYQSFYADGAKKIVTLYRDGKLHGRYKQWSEDQTWQRDATYKAGQLHGKVTIKRDRKLVSKQKWVRGELVNLDGIRPFPRTSSELRGKLADILRPVAIPVAAKSDPQAEQRAAALRRLQAYRNLCGLRYEDLELVPKWNDLCDAAGEVCRANGGISHTPAKPSGFDDARFAQGYEGASRSNLIGGGGMVRSVDAYMDDSDPSNIARVGHRRWCLNPAMKFTAFGGDGGYSAMWAMDSSGSRPRGKEAVFFPPPGKVPVDFFGPQYAWSLAIMRGPSPKKTSDVKISIQPLDAYYQPEGEVLGLNYLEIAGTGQGTGKCLVFRPRGLIVRDGARYLTRVSFDGGKTEAYRYVVEFCEPIGG